MELTKITLEEFLDYFDFGYKIANVEVDDGEFEPMFQLVDNDEANLGGIEDEYYGSVEEIVDRLDMYIDDYIIDDLEEILDEDYDVKAESGFLSEIVKLADEVGLKDESALDMARYILDPDYIIDPLAS